MPDKVLWPRKFEDRERPARPAQSAWRAEGATLVLKVDGPRAIEVQHRAQQILERVNTHFGYRAIGPIALPAGAGEPRRECTAPAPSPPVDEAALPASGAFADQGLAHALMRLGTGVRSKDQED